MAELDDVNRARSRHLALTVVTALAVISACSPNPTDPRSLREATDAPDTIETTALDAPLPEGADTATSAPPTCTVRSTCTVNARAQITRCNGVPPALTPFGHDVGGMYSYAPVFGPDDPLFDLITVPGPLWFRGDGRAVWLWSRHHATNRVDVQAGLKTLEYVQLPTAISLTATPIAAALQPRGALRTSDGAIIFGAPASPHSKPRLVAFALDRGGSVRWRAALDPASLAPELPDSVRPFFNEPFVFHRHEFSAAREPDGVWMVYAPRAEHVGGEFLFLFHIDTSGALRVRAALAAPKVTSTWGRSPRIAVDENGRVGILEPSVPGRVGPPNDDLNPTISLHCFDPSSDTTTSTVVSAPTSYRVPLSVLPGADGFRVLSAIYGADELPDAKDIKNGHNHRPFNRMDVSFYTAQCKLRGRRQVHLWSKLKRGLLPGSIVQARLRSGGVILSGLTSSLSSPLGAQYAGGAVVLDPELRLVRANAQTDMIDLIPPQVMHDGRVVRSVCRIEKVQNGGLQPTDWYYVISDEWLHDSCEEAGVCFEVPIDDCRVGDPCQIPTCHPTKGCVSAPLAEGSPCGVGGSCVQGKCVR